MERWTTGTYVERPREKADHIIARAATRHPKEGSLAHYGTLVKDDSGKILGVYDEEIRKRHRRMVTSRSHNAKASASGKVERFVKVNTDTDTLLDSPAPSSPLPTWEFTHKGNGTRNLRRSIRRIRGV